MTNHEEDEWNILLTRDGKPVVSNADSVWKVSYNTGIAVIESIRRIERILKDLK